MGPEPSTVENNYKHRGNEKMKALMFFGKEDVRVEDAYVPEITQDVSGGSGPKGVERLTEHRGTCRMM